MVGAAPELPVPLLVGRDCPLFAALWEHELRKEVRAIRRREQGRPIACVAQNQTVDQPVSMGPELEGVPEPDPPGEQLEAEPILPLIDFFGTSRNTLWGPTEGTIWDCPVVGYELESRHNPSDSGGWTATSGGE